ncbi:MAG: hypothetical protein IJ642_13010 [Oscillospiraceae bacterium]|nr:hypothetical protein [Oscillospiraceae bacterium]
MKKQYEDFTGALFTEETEPVAAEKAYTAEYIQKAIGFNPEHVKITSHAWTNYDGTKSTVFRAAFVPGTSYRIPANCLKSAAADVVFTVLSNNGKTVKIDSFEKYNGEIKTETGKRKPVCSGSHGIWCSYDPETNKFSGSQSKYPVEFIQIDTIDLAKVSRWTSGRVSCVECVPMAPAELEEWKQNTGTATTSPAQPERKEVAELDFTPVFYPVSEELARQHKHMISWDEYKTGKVTAEYQESVKAAYELARVSSDPEKSLYLANCYSKRLARWYDDYNRNGAACPSIMIAGPANFPVRKKEKQNARFDTLMKQYDKINHLLEKIRKPHGYDTEIRRDTITAEEFENILYFETVINEEENRLQLVFDGKPEEAERNILKKHGFRWSPRYKIFALLPRLCR